MRKRSSFLTAVLFLAATLPSLKVFAQDYPYEEGTPKKGAAPREDIPTESPDDLEKAGNYKKRTSLFRMAVKGGMNFDMYQPAGLTQYGIGGEARLAFGWDMAFQPIYLETEFGYRGMNLNTLNRLNVILVQQGLYFRERLGKTTMWKPGLLTTIDLRLISTTTGTATSVYPSVGLTSMWEFGAFLFQISAYFHDIKSQNNFLSGAALAGFKF